MASSSTASRALFIVQRAHAGFLDSFEHDQSVRLQRAYAIAQRGEARIYRYAHDEMAYHGRSVGNYGDHQRSVLVRTIRKKFPELVAFVATSVQVLNSTYGRVRVNAFAKMKRRVNIGRARRRAGC